MRAHNCGYDVHFDNEGESLRYVVNVVDGKVNINLPLPAMPAPSRAADFSFCTSAETSPVRRTMALIKAAQPANGQRYFVLIVDCGGDRLVKDRIREEHQGLTTKGFSKIIGMRDVRPQFTRAEIPRLEANLPTYIRTSLIPVEFVLSVMEIEAWFLSETTHFARIDPAITVESIRNTLGFDPVNDDMAERQTPSQDLNDCYALAGKAYEKHTSKNTTDVLDYAHIYRACKSFCVSAGGNEVCVVSFRRAAAAGSQR